MKVIYPISWLFHSIENKNLAPRAADCGIVLGKNPEQIVKNINLLKARELAQAVLAATSKSATQENLELVEEESVVVEDIPLVEEHSKLMESILMEELVLPSEVVPKGNPGAEGMNYTKMLSNEAPRLEYKTFGAKRESFSVGGAGAETSSGWGVFARNNQKIIH